MSDARQGLKNHARLDPPYHLLTYALYLGNLGVAIASEIHHHDFGSTWYLVLSIFIAVPLVKLRSYPLKVQDRVIRLRLQALAPSEWHTQIYRLSEDQLVGLRFAGDDEVVDLAKQALEHNLNRKQIKERIKNWRADEWRV
jgi:hypothetical protein